MNHRSTTARPIKQIKTKFSVIVFQHYYYHPQQWMSWNYTTSTNSLWVNLNIVFTVETKCCVENWFSYSKCLLWCWWFIARRKSSAHIKKKTIYTEKTVEYETRSGRCRWNWITNKSEQMFICRGTHQGKPLPPSTIGLWISSSANWNYANQVFLFSLTHQRWFQYCISMNLMSWEVVS